MHKLVDFVMNTLLLIFACIAVALIFLLLGIIIYRTATDPNAFKPALQITCVQKP